VTTTALPARVFRAALRLLPEDFRAGYARDMEATFRAECDERRGRLLATLGLWLATLADVSRAGATEHLDILRRDLRFALRAMAARPLHSATALGTLALALGAIVAVFAVVDGVLLAPLPYRDPARLVTVTETQDGADPSSVGYLSFLDLRERSRSFERLVAASQSTATLTDSVHEAERVNAMRVSSGYFEMLGVRPSLGRAFTEAEDRPGAARRVAILSDRLYRRRFAADPALLGGVLLVGGTPYRVIGVMPQGFDDLVAARMYDGAELWFPLGYDPAASYACRTCRHLGIFGRLAPGATPESATGELSRLFQQLETEYPTQYNRAGARVSRVADVLLGPVRPVLLLLAAGVIALLFVAAAHVANLLLLRASERETEMAVRTSLGVSRARLVRQLMTESLLLALIAGLGGLLLAWAALRWLLVHDPAQLPRLAQVGLAGPAAALGLALSLACGLAFGLVPLRRLLAASPGLTRGAGRRTASGRTWRLREALVSLNVAAALLLLVGSGLLVRSLDRLLDVGLGFEPRGVLSARLWLSGERFRAGDNQAQIAAGTSFYAGLLDRLRALPGVRAAAAVSTLPLGGGVDRYGIHIAGRPYANPEAAPSADRFVVTPGFFETLRIPLLRGRLLGERDTQGSEAVVVVNRTLARELFPGEDPLGQQLSLGPPSAARRTIVGVVDDIRHHGLDVPPRYQVYVPQSQWAWAETSLTLLVRSDTDPLALARPLRQVVRSQDASQPLTDVRTYPDVVASASGTRRLAATLLASFACAALLLSIAGLYGSVGVFVGQRRQEIGVRLALGAAPGAIRRLVLAQGMRPVLVGLAAGLAAAAVSTRALRSLLFGVQPLDPGTFAATTLLLLVFAVAACAVPAARAAATDPARTLRSE